MVATVARREPQLTRRQALLIDFLRRYYAENGMPATLAEIVDRGLYRSASSAHYALRALERKRLLRRFRRQTSTYFVPVRLEGEGEGCPTCGCERNHGY